MKLTVAEAPESLSRVKVSTRPALRVALVQTRWHQDQAEHESVLIDGI
jgi:N-carbamoylputrescine amidase